MNVKIAPPSGRRRLPEPPKPDSAPDNLGTPTDEGFETFQNLNFKVPPAFHRRFRLEATLRQLSMKALLEASFQCYLDTNGGTLTAPKADLI